jgi:hypothetical protein
LFDRTKILFDKAYEKTAISKTVGEVLKAVEYSIAGKEIVRKIQTLIKEEEN